MENKTNVWATLLGAIVILVLFVGMSFFIGQKIKENFSKPKVVKTAATIDEPSTDLLTDKKTETSPSGKYKTIPQTGPESIGLILIPVLGAAGVYVKTKFAS